jgi:hypothetical protein
LNNAGQRSKRSCEKATLTPSRFCSKQLSKRSLPFQKQRLRLGLLIAVIPYTYLQSALLRRRRVAERQAVERVHERLVEQQVPVLTEPLAIVDESVIPACDEQARRLDYPSDEDGIA